MKSISGRDSANLVMAIPILVLAESAAVLGQITATASLQSLPTAVPAN